MKKNEYQNELESIQRWHDRKTAGLCDYDSWREMDTTNRCVAASLNALIDLLIARELHHISQEKKRSKQ